MNYLIGICAILFGSFKQSSSQAPYPPYLKGCSVTGGEGGNPVAQCYLPEYWGSYNYTCGGSDWNFVEREPITKTQNDFSNNDEKWTTVMWFSDSVWAGTLLTYQQILQHAFTYAVIDLHDKWHDTGNISSSLTTSELTVDEVYVNVTFFLGFCLLANDKCSAFKDDELEEYDADGDIAGDMEDEDADYYVYANFYGSEDKYKYVHRLMTDFGYDFMTYASLRMQCTNWTDVLNISSEESDGNSVEYKAYAFYAAPLKKTKPWAVPIILNFIVYGFVAFCVVFAIVGAIHGFGYWKADCIRISGIIYFGLYTWDFYSDIVFCLSLYDCEECPRTLFYADAVFVVVPWIANMVALSRYQNKWCKDETIRERVYQWFVSWQRLTYALAALSGSAFGTVELANSYVFGLDFFCMGLNERHLKKFNNNRLYSSILVENAPQICIQILFFMEVGFDEITNNYIALMALITSTLSVGAALLDIYASKKLFSVLKKDGQYVGKTSCSISVVSAEIKQHATRLQISTYAFREAIAETLSTHPRSVEMHFPIATSVGFKMKFTIFSSKLTPDVILRGLKLGSRQKLPKRIQHVWRLTKPVAIPEERIEVERVQNDEIEGGGLSHQNYEENTGAQIRLAGTGSFDPPTGGDGDDGGNGGGDVEDQLQTSNNNDKLEGGLTN